MRVHYLQHVPFEGLGSMAEWFSERGDQVSRTRFFAGESVPTRRDYDLLVVMGGPMGVHDEDEYPWLADEKQFILGAIADGKRLLGVCLGAQLIATVLGARVTKNRDPEIGWFPIERYPQAQHSAIGRVFPERQTVLHWHGDTFALPPGATPLYRSQACENQGFVVEERIVGLQFHLEMTEHGVGTLINNCRDELIDSPYVQGEEQIRKTTEFLRPTNECMSSLLNVLCAEGARSH